MQMIRIGVLFLVLALSVGCSTDPSDVASMTSGEIAAIADGLRFDIIAKEPLIVTPTGIAIDAHDRAWVIENHTHVRQDDYPGPAVDRILIFDGSRNHFEQPIEYATDFVDAMSLSVIDNGKVIVATRAALIQFEDTDSDDKADRRDTLVSLLTDETFPHNGMSGLVLGPDDRIYFQCGENFGADYLLTGSDGKSIHGKEREGGSIYRCAMDGSQVERISTAVWNCFAMTFDDYGNLFAVENDPDSRPPCRLLHIVKGGNYGFQFQHGRDGLSPLTSWFGELPGTLPMVAGTGEAPSGLIHYTHGSLGEDRIGSLMVTAWGDHEIELYHLTRKGSSFAAEEEILVKGGRDFYPVGLAIQHDGGVLVTDWADVSYAVHGKGRIWRLEGENALRITQMLNDVKTMDEKQLITALSSQDPRLRTTAAEEYLGGYVTSAMELIGSDEITDAGKMNLIWAAKKSNKSSLPKLLETAIQSKNELLRAAAIRIMIEEDINDDENYYLNLIDNDPSPFVVREAIYGLHSQFAFEKVKHFFSSEDPFLHTALIAAFGVAGNLNFLLSSARSDQAEERLGALLCIRRSGLVEGHQVIPEFLNDPVERNRITALKWIAEDNLQKFRSAAEQSFAKAGQISSQLFDTYVVAFQYLDGRFDQKSHFMEGDEHVSRTFYKRQKFLLATASNAKLGFSIRTRALSSIDPHYEDLQLIQLIDFANEPDVEFQVEAVRSINARADEEDAMMFLQEIASDEAHADLVRAEAIVGMATGVQSNNLSREILLQIVESSESQVLKSEAARSLRVLSEDETVRPFLQEYVNQLPQADMVNSPEYWSRLGYEQGNASDGARTFFNPSYQCISCHRIDGRGGIVGPDLSKVGSNANRDRIIQSLLVPEEIMSPQYAGYIVSDSSGDSFIGRIDKDLDSKRHLQMILTDGTRHAIAYDDIMQQEIMELSLMPSNLHRLMAPDEFRNLVEYLAQRQ